MTLAVVVLVGLAAFRVARLVTEDTILDPPRDAFLCRWGDRHPKLAELVTCPHCVGVWASAGLWVLWANGWLRPVVTVAAVAGVVSIIASWEAK